MSRIISLENVLCDNKPIVLPVKKIVDYLNNNANSDKDRVLRIFEIATLLQHSYNAYDYRDYIQRDLEVHNVYKLINAYGYGMCKQSTVLMEFLLDIFGIRSRVLYLGRNFEDEFDHFAIEVYYDTNWHYFDPNLNFYFLNESKQVASVEQISKGDYVNVVGEFNAKRWLAMDYSHFEKLADTNKFQSLYLKMFERVEPFFLNDDRFDYKKIFMQNRGLLKWYNYHEKESFVDENMNIKVDYKGWGIVKGAIVKSDNYLNFKNLIFKYKYDSNYLILNDFSFPILDLKFTFAKAQSMVTIVINGEKFTNQLKNNESLFEMLEKNTNIYSMPIYSFEVTSDETILEYEMRVQSSNLVDKICEVLGE